MRSQSFTDKENNMKKYYAAGFFDEKLRGLSDNLLTNSFDEAVDKIHKMASDGSFVMLKNEETGESATFPPDEWMNAIDNGDIPEAAKRLV